MQTLSVKTDRRTQLVDLTAQVQKAVASSGVANGVCYLYVPHTTAAITIVIQQIYRLGIPPSPMFFVSVASKGLRTSRKWFRINTCGHFYKC